ncbi:ABC transporter substrate-binding protein [Microterricola pindariensis]|uniref:ABC transporter substrate-binding protein n=1 Tax=Microterricola pindariensis TaxID=478010 RepID=A0ABX5AVA0_9MICO|nr:ABC transporter substrate-binding protein [Microterricola pindariensis]PPL18871.1 ABC transporter substrate-binding protein [Microterricola pindariensis]
MTSVRPARRLLFVAAASLLAVSLVGCVQNAPTTAAPTGEAVAVGADDAVTALVPAAIAESGALRVGVNLTYSPNEFKTAEGAPTGWAIELMDAIGAKMGLEVEYQGAAFDNILPGVIGGKYDVGQGSFTDTKEREKIVDFVNYYSAGTRWAAAAGSTLNPDDACGLVIAAGATTYQETDDIPARSEACVAAGKEPISILKLETQDDITNAVVLGRAAGFAADSPVTAYAVSATQGKLELIGEQYDSAPFGFAVAKESGTLAQAVEAAVQSIIDDGSYGAILAKWGVEDGAVSTAGINGALF